MKLDLKLQLPVFVFMPVYHLCQAVWHIWRIRFFEVFHSLSHSRTFVRSYTNRFLIPVTSRHLSTPCNSKPFLDFHGRIPVTSKKNLATASRDLRNASTSTTVTGDADPWDSKSLSSRNPCFSVVLTNLYLWCRFWNSIGDITQRSSFFHHVFQNFEWPQLSRY